MLMFGNKPCLSVLRVGLGFCVSLQVSCVAVMGQSCASSVVPADGAIGRIDPGNNTLLRPHDLKITLQKGVLWHCQGNCGFICFEEYFGFFELETNCLPYEMRVCGGRAWGGGKQFWSREHFSVLGIC